jgi:type IV pilus assembly protein PilB
MVLNLQSLRLPQRLVELLPASVAYERWALPLTECGPALALAVPEPEGSDVGDFLRFVLARDVLLVRASSEQLRSAVERHYDPVEYLDNGFPHFIAGPATIVDRTPLTVRPAIEDLPVVRLTELLLGEAIQLQASALEIEPYLGPGGIGVRVWHYFQGERRRRAPLPGRVLPGITARLRKLANIAPVLHPVQTGVIPLLHRGLSYRLPVRITATSNGPHIHVTIPPTPADPPAVVVNPAA